MARMTKKEILAEQESFFINKKGEYEYAKKCVGCTKKCKQSFRATIVSCKNYQKVAK